jgi:m7GpppX diphosphatase
MRFKNLEVLEYRSSYNIYYGVIKNNFAVLFADKNLADEIDIGGELLMKNENVYKFNQKGINTLYYPVDQDFIDSFKTKIKIIDETYEDYNKKIEPYIDSIIESNTKWMNNILYHKSEAERILFKNKYFTIIKNICWDSLNDFYLLVIPFEKIKNIRHLNNSHKDLLNQMKIESIKIANGYNIDEDELYFFFHYHPSCYQLHLHVCLLNHKSLKLKLYRHIMLDEIIDDLENFGKRTIRFESNISNPIYKILKGN